jgi:hypothetical protein
MKSVRAKGGNVKQFEELLQTEFESKWEAHRKRRGAAQTSLFTANDDLGLG